MRQLQVQGVSDDGAALLLAPDGRAGKPTHRIPLDDKLRAVVRGQLGVLGTSERAESALSPKEIQARLRAGATPEEVAKAAQIPLARLMPYVAPVLAERQRIVDDARGAVVRRSRGPAAERPLGQVVDAHLAETSGLREDSVEWTALRRHDGAWVVELRYAARGGRRTASWLWRPVGRELTALDSAASRLAHEEAPAGRSRPARRPATARPRTKATAKRSAAAKRSSTKAGATKAGTTKAGTTKAGTTKRKPAVRSTAATAVAAKGVSARKPAPKKPVPKKPAPKKPALKKPALKKPAATKPALTKPPLKKTAVKKAAPPKPAAAKRSRAADEAVVLPLPAARRVRREPRQIPPPPERKPGTRVSVPSWSDVLLGVSGPREPDPDPGPVDARRRRKA